MDLVKTTAPDFAQDRTTGALVNTNQDALRTFKAQQAHHREQQGLVGRVDRLERHIAELESRLNALECKK